MAMTVHAVLVDPPRPGFVLPRIAADGPLSPGEAAELYLAMVKDSFRAIARSSGELLINYRDPADLPSEYRTDGDVEAEFRGHAKQALDNPDAARFEVQVGSSFDARAGNTVTHLLRDEDASSVSILDGQTPTITRPDLDTAGMKLRRSDVVIGPSPGGHVYYAGFTEPIDFNEAFAPPEVQTLTTRAEAIDAHVDFLPMHPRIETARDLVTLVSIITARREADRIVPAFTADVIDRFQLSITVEDGDRTINRKSRSS